MTPEGKALIHDLERIKHLTRILDYVGENALSRQTFLEEGVLNYYIDNKLSCLLRVGLELYGSELSPGPTLQRLLENVPQEDVDLYTNALTSSEPHKLEIALKYSSEEAQKSYLDSLEEGKSLALDKFPCIKATIAKYAPLKTDDMAGFLENELTLAFWNNNPEKAREAIGMGADWTMLFGGEPNGLHKFPLKESTERHLRHRLAGRDFSKVMSLLEEHVKAHPDDNVSRVLLKTCEDAKAARDAGNLNPDFADSLDIHAVAKRKVLGLLKPVCRLCVEELCYREEFKELLPTALADPRVRLSSFAADDSSRFQEVMDGLAAVGRLNFGDLFVFLTGRRNIEEVFYALKAMSPAFRRNLAKTDFKKTCFLGQDISNNRWYEAIVSLEHGKEVFDVFFNADEAFNEFRRAFPIKRWSTRLATGPKITVQGRSLYLESCGEPTGDTSDSGKPCGESPRIFGDVMEHLCFYSRVFVEGKTTELPHMDGAISWGDGPITFRLGTPDEVRFVQQVDDMPGLLEAALHFNMKSLVDLLCSHLVLKHSAFPRGMLLGFAIKAAELH